MKFKFLFQTSYIKDLYLTVPSFTNTDVDFVPAYVLWETEG